MPRYVSRTVRAWYDFGEDFDTRAVPSLGQPLAYCSPPVDTGLLDADGNAIMRLPDEIGYYAKDRKASDE
jgi:hypothetical protein